MDRLRDLAKGVAALVVLIALVFGVPMALISVVGWPLPRGLPTWGAISDSLTLGRVDETTVFKVFAVVVWVAWLQTTVAAVTEAMAVVRRHTPSRALMTPPSVQLGIGRLVTAAALLLTSLSSVRPSGALPLPLPMAMPPVTLAASGLVIDTPTTGPGLSTVDAPELRVASNTREWLVHRRETLWSIAETVLGDGSRYTELVDLNRGRQQPDGQVLTSAESLRPGWILRLPEDAAIEPAPVGAHRVVPGDTLAQIAKARLGHASRWTEIWDLNRDRAQIDGRSLVDADLLRPGWVLRLPGAIAEMPPPAEPTGAASRPAQPLSTTELLAPALSVEPVSPEPAETAWQVALGPVTDTAPAPVPGGAPAADAPEPAAASGSLREAVGWGGGIVLAAGALTALEKARRRRLTRHGVRGLQQSPRSARDLELVLRTTDGLDDVAWADATLRSLRCEVGVDGTGRTHSLAPILVELRLDGSMEVWWETPRPDPVQGWSTTTTGRSWTRLRSEPLTVPSALAPCPALVSIGRADTGSEVLVNLEASGLLSVHGDTSATDLVRAMGLELATSPFADVSTILLCGFPIDGITHLDRVVPVDADAALDWLRDRTASTGTKVARRGGGGGTGGLDDPWEPVIVICGHGGTRTDAHEAMSSLVSPGSGAAMIVVGADRIEDGWSLQVQDGRAVLEPFDIAIRVQAASIDSVERLSGLLDAEDARSPEGADDRAGDASPVRLADVSVGLLDPAAAAPQVGDDLGDSYDVIIRVLGDVVVEQGPDITNPQQLELLTFLAVHRRGASSSEILDAVWPEGRSVKTFQNAVSRLRKALDRGRDGAPLLPYGDGQRYTVSPRVRTDWDRFLALVRQADLASPTEATLLLHEAMTMVHGRPFRAPRGYEWAVPSGMTAEITETVKLAALRLGELYLDANDATGALWAAKRGRRAVETAADSQHLTRLTMAANHRIGDTPAALAAHQELIHACDDLDCEPIPEVQAIYQAIRATALAH